MIEKERVTVDLDAECYYLDGEFWESWDNYGEDMADAINKEFNKLSEENEQLKQFKELLCAVLKQEYEDRTNEMNRWAEKEDWNGYRATKLEYGTVIRIAKRIGVDLE